MSTFIKRVDSVILGSFRPSSADAWGNDGQTTGSLISQEPHGWFQRRI